MASKIGRRLIALERQRMALELRKSGATFAQIAEHVGYSSPNSAWRAVQSALKEITHEPALELRTLEMERYNYYLLKLWPDVQKGSRAAIETALRVQDRIDKLNGLEAPTEITHHVEGAVLVIEGSTDDYIAGLERMARNSGAIDTHELPPTATEPTERIGELGAGESLPLPGSVQAPQDFVLTEATDVLNIDGDDSTDHIGEPCARFVRPHDEMRREQGLCARCDQPKETHDVQHAG